MPIDSTPQPCPRCSRSTVLISYPWGRQWAHLGTWQPHCERPASPRAASGSPHGSGDNARFPLLAAAD